MPPVDRLNPIRGTTSESSCSAHGIHARVPRRPGVPGRDIWRARHRPRRRTRASSACEMDRVFKRYETAQRRPGGRVPPVGTTSTRSSGRSSSESSTSLHLWFYAMYLITSTRCGISAKHLERELGVTYETAWRMFNKIRNDLMAQDDAAPLSGEVEMDETFIGGKPETLTAACRCARLERETASTMTKTRAVVFGAVERRGRMRADRSSRIVGGRPSCRSPGITRIRPSRLPDLHGRIGRYNRVSSRRATPIGGSANGARLRRRRRHTQTHRRVLRPVEDPTCAAPITASRTSGFRATERVTWRWNRRKAGNPMFHDLIAEAVTRTL